jgi:outer membrane autotransporter protein
VTSGTQVTLTGSGTDTDGTIASYAWTRTGGTGTATNATLSDATAAQPTFTDSSLTSNDSLVTHIFELVVTDDDGAASSAVPVTITINPPDVTPPDPPKAEYTAVVRNQDDSITVSGTGAEPGATVKVIFPDGSVGSTVVKTQLVSLGGNSFSITESSGTYSVTSGPEQPSGTVRVVLIDAAGNASDALVHNIDMTAPDAPTAQNTTVTVNADSSVTVSGTGAEVDATARVTFPDGSVVEATVAGDGTYSVTSGPEQPSGTVKVVLLDAAGNASDALELRFVGVPTVAQIQTEIATYMQTRAGFVLAAQPDLIGFLSGNVTGALNAFVTKRNGTFNFATSGDDFGSPKKLPFWVRMQGNWSDNGQHKNSYYFGAVGAHRFLSPNAIAGLTLQYDRLKQQDGNTTTKGVGYLVGPYIIAKFPEQPLYFEGRYLFGKTDNSVSIDGGPPQNFKTDLSLLSFKIAGKLHYGDFTLTPSLTATHLEDKQDAFIDNYGRSVAEQGISMTDVALGLDFAKTLDVSNGRLLLTGGIAGVWSDTDGSGFASTITPKFDGQRARIRLGATYSLDGGMALSVGVNYDGIGVDNYESFSISFGLNAEF